jgi:hypothetical protein
MFLRHVKNIRDTITKIDRFSDCEQFQSCLEMSKGRLSTYFLLTVRQLPGPRIGCTVNGLVANRDIQERIVLFIPTVHRRTSP